MRISDRYERFADRVGQSGTQATKQAGKTGAVDKTAPAAPAKPPEPGVLTVYISDFAAHLSASAARLEELKSSIQSGTYQVDAKGIASKLIGDE